MKFKFSKSSGLINNIVPFEIIDEMYIQIEKKIFSKNISLNISENNYVVKDDFNRVSYISNISEFINIDKLKNYFDEINSKIIFNIKDFVLASSELHVRWPECEKIPPHQDNFYHCFKDLNSFKILIPLTGFIKPNSFLNYANVNLNQTTLTHIASSVPAFSSFIPDSIISNLKLDWINYEFNLGDVLWHSINSIHFANKNRTNSTSLFLVFRFDEKNSIIDQKMLNNYSLVFEEHKELIRNLN